MAKVTLRPNDEAAKVVVTDALGRSLTLREPEFFEEFRLMEAVGAEASSHGPWMAAFTPLTYVVEIDGVPIPLVSTKAEADALIKRVGRAGFNAVLKAMKEHFNTTDADIDFAKN